MVRAVHDDRGESIGDGGLDIEEGQVERSIEVALGEVSDEGELLLMSGAVEDQLVEWFGTMGFGHAVTPECRAVYREARPESGRGHLVWKAQQIGGF